jgi:glutamyl-tRNA reductase
MSLAVVGLSHRTAPIEVREKLAFGRAEVPVLLARLLESGAAEEAVLLSTCNRTELCLSLPDLAAGEEAVRTLLAERMPEVSGYLYLHRDKAAVEHLLRVTAGLDSMVVGEPQIQGQVRDAYQAARESFAGGRPATGAVLNRLFQHALGVGGRVRSETQLGIGAASVSSAAVELAKKIFGSLHGRRALVMGAGEMSEVTLECLRSEGVKSCVVANRTYEHAHELAERWGGRAVRWESIAEELPGADIVVCSTAAPHHILTRERFRAALPGGPTRPLCIIDIATPRDVEPQVGSESNVFLYNIDDLKQVVDVNLDRRRAELPKAEAIVAAGVGEFWGWYEALAVVPTIRDLRDRGEEVRRAEVEKALGRLSHLAPADREAVDALTRSILNKLLHAPTVRLREAAGTGRGLAVLDSVRYLFELDEREHPEAPAEEVATPPAPEPPSLDPNLNPTRK